MSKWKRITGSWTKKFYHFTQPGNIFAEGLEPCCKGLRGAPPSG